MDCPQNLEMGLSVSSLLHRECAKEQEQGGSEGIRQWHREEPELGTAPAQGDTGDLPTGCHRAGIALRGSKPITGTKYVI